MNHHELLYTVNCKKGGNTFVVITLENVFNNFYTSGNRNEYLPQISCLLIYFICNVNMNSLSHKIK